MAKIMKWCIFLVCLTLFTSDPAGATQRRNMLEGDCMYTIVEQDHSPENTLRALICQLFNGVAEISQMSSHLSFDSKSHFKLLVHLRYSKINLPVSEPGVNTCPDKTFFQPERTEYYIYALRKIII